MIGKEKEERKRIGGRNRKQVRDNTIK